MMSETRQQAPAEPVPDTVEQAIRLRAKEVAWDEGPLEMTWESNHSCGVGRYGCCGGGKDIDRAALAKAIEEALRWAFAAGAQGEREALLEIARKAERDSADPRWMIEQIEARMSATPPDAPAGRE